jgi:uncharacterized protein YeeX (DUF496 family)
MPAKKGFTNNPAGRPVGTQNKVTSELKAWITELIDTNREQFEIDLKTIEPEKRLLLLEKLMSFVVPKMQSVSVEAQINAEYQALEKLLEKAPTEAIEQITARITKLRREANIE